MLSLVHALARYTDIWMNNRCGFVEQIGPFNWPCEITLIFILVVCNEYKSGLGWEAITFLIWAQAYVVKKNYIYYAC